MEHDQKDLGFTAEISFVLGIPIWNKPRLVKLFPATWTCIRKGTGAGSSFWGRCIAHMFLDNRKRLSLSWKNLMVERWVHDSIIYWITGITLADDKLDKSLI